MKYDVISTSCVSQIQRNLNSSLTVEIEAGERKPEEHWISQETQ